MSSHHPEHWQPSWSVRVALVALIAFLPTSGHGAIGSLVSFAGHAVLRVPHSQAARLLLQDASAVRLLHAAARHMRMLYTKLQRLPYANAGLHQR